MATSYTRDYLEAKNETGIPVSNLQAARQLEKKWELADWSLPAASVLGSGIDSFDNLSEFLGSRKQESFESTKDSLVGTTEIDKILGTTTSDDVAYVQAQVNNLSMMSMYDTFLGIYMSPNGAFTDINYRLGKVSKTLLDNLDSDQVNADGSLYTRSNFNKKFNYQLLKSYGTFFGYSFIHQYNTNLYYANLFFPPYASPSDPNRSFLSTYIQPSNRSSRNGTISAASINYASYLKNSAKWANNESLHFDESNFTLKRDGAFTYRHAGFKSINDNITFLQWIFENTTGVVSTYLTEWDMSVYFQEGFIPNKNNQRLSLLYRMSLDNPMKDYATYNDKTTDANNLNYLTFGVVNAAVSLETTNLKWNVEKFPLSRYWTKYPMTLFQEKIYTDDYAEQAALLASPILSDYERACLKIQMELETETIYTPDFYETSSLNPSILFNGDSTIFDKIEYFDRRGAAVSGWWSWQPYYYKALYTIPGNELSNLDANNMIEDASNIYDVAVANKNEGGATNGDGSDSESSGAGSSGYGSSSGGRKWYKSKKPSSGSNGAAAAKAKGNKYVSSSVYVGIEDKITNSEGNISQGGDETFDETKSLKYSDASGMSPCNPVFYGGPHGASRSPKNPKSFFEINNPILRNFPRIDPPESFDSKDLKSYLTGLNQYYSYKTKYGSNDWQEADRIKGVSENSFVGGLNLMKNGIQEKRFMLTMKRVKRYVNVSPDWWWWGWWSWWRSWRWGDSYPTHVYNYNGNYWGWQKLYYESATTYHTHGHWGNNISGYDLNGDGWPDYSRWNWYWHCNWGTRRAYYYAYEWGWSERYMLHGEPYTQWKMSQISYNNYTIDIPFSTISYWFSTFKRYRSNVVSYVRAIGASKKRIELTGTGYYATVRSYGNWPTEYVFWNSGTVRLMNWFVKNSRDYGQNNYLIFMAGDNIYYSGGFAAPDAIFRAPVQMKEYSFVYFYNAHDHRHRCHRHDCQHSAIGWREYIDVDLYTDDENVPFALMSTSQNAWTNLYAQDVFEELGPTPNYARRYNDISQLFNGNELKGCGVYSSIQGFDPVIEEIEGTNYHELLNLNRLADTRFCDIRFNYFSINNYAIAPRNTFGGYSYYPIGGVETYSVNSMPREQSLALFRGMVSAGLYQAGRNDAYLCFADAPFRLLYAQLCNQVQFYKIAIENVLADNVLPAANIREMLLKCVDPSVIKVSWRNLSTYDNEDVKYNYWIERAFTHFNKTPSLINQYIASVRNEISTIITSYETLISLLEPLIRKHIFCWTYNELYTAILEYLPIVKKSVSGDLMFDEFFYCYLNILYEYRKYFINKRFNKVDGTMYQLRHLEGVLSYMKAKTSTGEISDLDYSGNSQAESVAVAFYKIDNTAEDKAQALLTGKALSADKIRLLYIPVTYSTEARYLKELAKKKSDDGYIMKVIKTSRTDSAKLYAEVPIDHKYKLISDQYIKNENDKKINAIITKKYLSDNITSNDMKLISTANPDYSVLIKNIFWGDEDSKTPIEESVAVNIDATSLLNALQVTDDINEAVCAAKSAPDFWTINVLSSNCQARGYKTGLKLVPYTDADSTTSTPTVEESAMGVSAYQLWPISEEQAQITTVNSVSESQRLRALSDTGLETGSEFFSS